MSKKRTPTTSQERAKRRQMVSDLYCKGKSQWMIADIIGISAMQVSRDLKIIREEWKERYTDTYHNHQMRELSKIDKVERESWQAWDKSCGERTIRNIKDSEKYGQERAIRKEELTGDPRFLSQILDCVDKRCKILGIDAPVITKNTTTLEVNQNLTPDEMDKRIEELLARREKGIT